MGEANRETFRLIKCHTGHDPEFAITPDGKQCLHIGDCVLVATSFALWSDPNVWLNDNGSLTVGWGGQVAHLSPDSSGERLAEVK